MTCMKEHKIAVLAGVREHMEGSPVELWLNDSGRIVLRAYNECQNNCTDVDLDDLINWLRVGSWGGVAEHDRGIAALSASGGDQHSG